MNISSTSHASSSSRPPENRQVIPSNNSSEDRVADEKTQATLAEKKSQAQAHQEHELERNQQEKRDEQRRLDGRLVSLGHKNGDEATDYKQLELKRERVKEAYTPPAKSESHKAEQQRQPHDNEAIDLVV